MVSANGINGKNAKEIYVANNAYKLPNFSIDEARPIKVVVIGAGYSGKRRVEDAFFFVFDVRPYDSAGITAGIRYAA